MNKISIVKVKKCITNLLFSLLNLLNLNFRKCFLVNSFQFNTISIIVKNDQIEKIKNS